MRDEQVEQRAKGGVRTEISRVGIQRGGKD